jgi:hypothetical protein
VILLSTSVSGAFAENPLFHSDEPLTLVLEFPLRGLLRQAEKTTSVPGVLRYTDSDGTEVVLDIEVSKRGNSRLEHCRYPPLKINLKKKQVESTLFAGQNNLKLVTLCRSTASYRRYLREEYIVYKIYNLLSEYSFRARMLEVSYHEPGALQPKETHPAFFIESDDEMAKRLQMKTLDTNVVNISQLDPTQLSILTLFQFLIGNTDWSVRKAPGNEDCCHNGKVIAPPDSRNGWVVLPYDFDQAGIINTSYALPSESLPIRSVRQRLYRGYCSNNAQLDSTIAMFNDKRAAIEALFDNEYGGSSRNKSVRKYLQGFYEVVDDPKKRQKKIIDVCN